MQHRLYALSDAARNGDAAARREHETLKAKLALLAPQVVASSVPDIDAPAPKVAGPAAPRRVAEALPPGEMRLGALPARGGMPAPGTGNRFRDWRVRAFEGQ